MSITLQQEPQIAKTGTYTLTPADSITLANGTFTIYLYTAAGDTGRVQTIRNIGSGTVTVQANGAQLLDAANTKALAPGEAIRISSDGTQWWTLDRTLHTANDSTYAFGKTEGALNVNSALTANSTTYVKANTGIVSNASGVFVNAAYINTIAANSATYVLANTGVVSNASGVFVNAAYINTLASNTALTANNSTYAYGKTEGTLSVNSALMLRSVDDRIIEPSAAVNAAVRFGFSSYNNDNAPPYADYFLLSGYVDGSGGDVNLLSLNKNGIGMRVWQKAFANTAAFSVYKDVQFQGDQINAAWITTGTLPAAQLSGTYANATVNNSTFAFGKAEGALNVNSALTSNNSTYAFGKTEGTLNVNNAVFISGNAVQTNATALILGSTAGLVANGGVGSAGQVLTSNGSSVYWTAGVASNSATFLSGNTVTTNSSGLFTTTAGKVGIGTAAPATTFHISADNVQPIIIDMGFGAGAGAASVLFRTARGNIASPTAVQTGDVLGGLGCRPYGATGYAATGRGTVTFMAAENFSDANQGTYLVVQTTPLGAAVPSEKFRIGPNGNVGIMTTTFSATLTVNGDIYVTNNCSALSFTDRTPFYDGDAVAELKVVKGKRGKDGQDVIDHATLPAIARRTVGEEPGRDLGAMISILTKAVQQLAARIEALESR
ncbi:MAG: beta strand repeat-containing protein [Candidatus Nanopelagicales bacterium]